MKGIFIIKLSLFQLEMVNKAVHIRNPFISGS